MIVKGHRVYRGRRGAGRSGSPVLLTILVLVLLGLLLAFSLLPEYVVYHRDGVEMVVPMLQEDGQGYTVEGISAPVPYTGDASAAIQVAEPDYTNVSLASSAGLQYLTGYYVPFSKVNANGLETAVKEAERSGVKGLVLEMKDESALVDRTYDNQNDFFHLNDNYLEEYKRDFALPLAFTAAPVLAEMPSGVLNDILRFCDETGILATLGIE